MDLLGYLFIGGLLLLGVLVVIGQIMVFWLRHKRTLAHYARPDLAAALGLPSAGVNQYAGVRAGVPVRFGYTLTRPGGFMQGAAYPLWAEVAIVPPLAVPLDIRPRMESGGVPIGCPDFDARYVVFSPEIPWAQRILTPALMPQFLSLAAHGGVTLTREQVKFRTDQSWTDPARVAWLLDAMIALSRQLCANAASLG